MAIALPTNRTPHLTTSAAPEGHATLHNWVVQYRDEAGNLLEVEAAYWDRKGQVMDLRKLAAKVRREVRKNTKILGAVGSCVPFAIVHRVKFLEL